MQRKSVAGEATGVAVSLVVAGMTPRLDTLDIRSRVKWRAWLGRHHASSPGVWLQFHKKHAGVESIPYEDAVCEALCFGWIDSLIKRLDADRYVRMFTPRQSDSRWSDLNRRRWAALKKAGLLAAPGLDAAPSGNTYQPRPRIPDLPGYIANEFKRNPDAWRSFRGLAPTYRRQFVGWIHTARRPETRAKRLRESVALLAAGKKLGLK